ncbi:MAG: hypothetical protein AB7P03_09055 [Kofleriaceae bacterium]
MHRLVPATFATATFALAACGGVDERPATLEYVTAAVLAPNCGNAQCHSSFSEAGGYAFDTVDVARESIRNFALVDVDQPDASLLYTVLTRSIDRMPYDQPLPDTDIDLILRWIENGAPGL